MNCGARSHAVAVAVPGGGGAAAAPRALLDRRRRGPPRSRRRCPAAADAAAPAPAPAAPAPAPAAAQQQQQPAALYHTADGELVTRFGFARDFAARYERGERVGSGAFATVYAATDRATGERVAVKSMPKRWGRAAAPDGSGGASRAMDPYYARRVRNEVDIASHLGPSLNVAYFHGAFEDDTGVDLVFELCTGGPLWGAARRGAYTEAAAAALVRDVLRVVAQCHAAGVVIRDVKPDNFLFASAEPGAPLKAIDWGMSGFMAAGEFADTKAGTPFYCAPELLKGRYSLGADVWSAGVTAYQILAGRLPYAGEEGDEVTAAHAAGLGGKLQNKDIFRAVLYADLDFSAEPWPSLSPGARDLVASLLTRDPAARPTAAQALAHPWLAAAAAAPGGGGGGGAGLPLCDTIVQRLQRFGTLGRLRQVALRRAAAALGADAALLDDARRLFEQLADGSDGGGGGEPRLSRDALLAALRGGRFRLSPAEAEQLLAAVDACVGGVCGADWADISYADFAAATADWGALRRADGARWAAAVAAAWAGLGAAGRAELSAAELEAALCGDEGCPFPDEVDAALRDASGVGGPHGITYDEFSRLLEAGATGAAGDLSLYDPRLVE